MDLATWHEVLAHEGLTSRQRGAVMREFQRLGYHPRYDRPERLRVVAALTGLDQVTSTADLTMGQAGALIDALQGCATRRGLQHLAGVEHRADLLEARPQTLADLVATVACWTRGQLTGTALGVKTP